MKRNLYYQFITFAFLLFWGTSATAQRLKFHRISATIEPLKLEYLFNNGLEIDHFGYEQKKYFTAEVSDEDIAILKKNNVKFTYVIEDLEKNLAKYNKEIDAKAKALKTNVTTPANFALGSYAGFFTFAEMQTHLDQMRALYPNLITVKSSIGTSIEGRSIFMVKISDNPDVDEAEPEVFMNAVHHAREPMSMSQLIFMMWHLLENYATDKDIQTMLNSTELYIVPCVNPDGYVYNQTTNPGGGGMWRKNRKNNGNGTFGVDLNRNYSFQWGIDNTGSSPTTSSDTYRGPSAFSEPESQAVRNFCNAHNFTLSMDFHSYGNYCIYPYGYSTTNSNPELSTFQQMGAFFTAENAYVHGNAVQTVNYTANGAGDDWKYGEQVTKPKIYSFTPEIGASTDGFWPASSRIIPLSNSTIEMNKKAIRVGTYYGKATSNSVSTINTLNGQISYTFQNYSVKPTSYTVSVTALSSYVASVGSPKIHSGLTLLQTRNDSISFSLNSGIPYGTPLQFLLTVDNGLSPRTDTVTIIYDCLAPIALTTTAISTNGATLNWGAVSGATDYFVSYKSNSSSTWGADLLVSGATNFTISGLNPATAYNWRVRTSTCNNNSLVANFTTLPICGTPASLTTTSITSTGATLNWGAVSGVTNYTVEYKTAASSTWITASAGTTSTSLALSGLTALTLYDWRVRANCPAGNSVYAQAQFTTASSVTYCASNGQNTSFMWIDYVRLGTINQTSGATAGGYFNGTAISTNLVRGAATNIQFSGGFSSTIYRLYWRVWIDYNRNGVFTDAGEQILSVSTTGSGISQVNFTPPSTALLGPTRMRVSAKYSSSPTSCQSFTYGEVEDYTVNITTSRSSGRTVEISANEPLEEPEYIEVNDLEEYSFIEEPTEMAVSAYPNPVNDKLILKLNYTDSEFRKVKLNNLQGSELLNTDVSTKPTEVVIDTKELTSGIYLINVQEANRRKTVKIIKQ